MAQIDKNKTSQPPECGGENVNKAIASEQPEGLVESAVTAGAGALSAVGYAAAKNAKNIYDWGEFKTMITSTSGYDKKDFKKNVTVAGAAGNITSGQMYLGNPFTVGGLRDANVVPVDRFSIVSMLVGGGGSKVTKPNSKMTAFKRPNIFPESFYQNKLHVEKDGKFTTTIEVGGYHGDETTFEVSASANAVFNNIKDITCDTIGEGRIGSDSNGVTVTIDPNLIQYPIIMKATNVYTGLSDNDAGWTWADPDDNNITDESIDNYRFTVKQMYLTDAINTMQLPYGSDHAAIDKRVKASYDKFRKYLNGAEANYKILFHAKGNVAYAQQWFSSYCTKKITISFLQDGEKKQKSIEIDIIRRPIPPEESLTWGENKMGIDRLIDMTAIQNLVAISDMWCCADEVNRALDWVKYNTVDWLSCLIDESCGMMTSIYTEAAADCKGLDELMQAFMELAGAVPQPGGSNPSQLLSAITKICTFLAKMMMNLDGLLRVIIKFATLDFAGYIKVYRQLYQALMKVIELFEKLVMGIERIFFGCCEPILRALCPGLFDFIDTIQSTVKQLLDPIKKIMDQFQKLIEILDQFVFKLTNEVSVVDLIIQMMQRLKDQLDGIIPVLEGCGTLADDAGRCNRAKWEDNVIGPDDSEGYTGSGSGNGGATSPLTPIC